MPIEQTDIKCLFCGSFLTDMDGMLDCQDGCHANQDWSSEYPDWWYYQDLHIKMWKLYDWLDSMITAETKGMYRPGAFRVTSGCYESKK